MTKKRIIIILSVLVLIVLILFGYLKKSNDQSDTAIEDPAIDETVDLDNGDEKVDWSTLDTEIIQLSNKTLTITKGGIYTLIGTITNGSVEINTTEDVKIILKGISITNAKGPAINIISSNNTIIELEKDTINTLEDGTPSDLELDGCIYSKSDLIIDGEGTLNITANYKDGIVSKDDLKIKNGNINIISEDDGIRGKDSVYIVNGNINITSKGDGIKATNEKDTEKGYVYIDNGNITINSVQDGISSVTKTIINNGNINIKTTSTEKSSKGIKSTDNLIINNGNITIDSVDDALHSNKYISIKGGNLSLTTKDDAIHADETILIDNGTINVINSYEGIEASNIIVNGGTIDIVSSDDGFNIAGGNDSSGRPGADMMATDGVLKITAGKITVNANGDGLDSNGSIEIIGGTIIVDGPSGRGNGPLDYNGTLKITGGTILAIGSSDMAQGASDISTQYSFLYNTTSTNSKNSVIKILNSSNEVIYTYTSKKTFSSIFFSSKGLSKGTYKIDINGTSSSITLTNVTTTTRNNQMNRR